YGVLGEVGLAAAGAVVALGAFEGRLAVGRGAVVCTVRAGAVLLGLGAGGLGLGVVVLGALAGAVAVFVAAGVGWASW
ncbi:hypothetical protein ABT317_51750, partial [Streptomyces carpinensis]